MSDKLDKPLEESILGLVRFYENEANQAMCKTFVDQLRNQIENAGSLRPLIHSLKTRIKEPSHLFDKLERKAIESLAAGTAFDIKEDNLFVRINDCPGLRIIHLHTKQIEEIDKALRDVLDYHRYRIEEGPIANIWDDDAEKYFKGLGFQIKRTPNMYTSVHYVVSWNARGACTCEIQVRTLSEELWGEVDHAVRYPHDTTSVSCREQLKVLARLTSGVTRLVDVIFDSHQVGESSNARDVIRVSIPEQERASGQVEKRPSERGVARVGKKLEPKSKKRRKGKVPG